jgi:hypothetical protein
MKQSEADMHTPRSGKVLVIGFGNDLCGEDAAGRMVAKQIARWNHPRVEAVSVHQLGPEFAKDIAEASMVIFVDAVPADQPISDLLERAGIRSAVPIDDTWPLTRREPASRRAETSSTPTISRVSGGGPAAALPVSKGIIEAPVVRDFAPQDAKDSWARITHPMLIRLHPAEFEVVLGHAPNPSVLLLLARALFGRSPRSYLVGIPATRFNFGDTLSKATCEAMLEAVDMVKGLAVWTPRAVGQMHNVHQTKMLA